MKKHLLLFCLLLCVHIFITAYGQLELKKGEIVDKVAGIIGCGAGLAKSLIKPEQIHPAYYLGIIGMKDFNYREMKILHDQFEQNEVAHRLVIHEGGHDWPPVEICIKAIEWLEIIGMHKNIHYNLASAYARNQNKNKALANLRLAVEHGFDDIEHMEQDEDLASIRDTEEFRKIIKSLK